MTEIVETDMWKPVLLQKPSELLTDKIRGIRVSILPLEDVIIHIIRFAKQGLVCSVFFFGFK